MEDERKDYLKALSRQCKRETLFCDMDDYTVNLFSSEDTYPSHFHTFEMDGFTVRIENSLLAEALENLDGKKRDVILRYYFLGFDDTEISKILKVNRSTIQRRSFCSFHLDLVLFLADPGQIFFFFFLLLNCFHQLVHNTFNTIIFFH